MSNIKKLDRRWTEPTPLFRSVEWALEFLNDLGGDYCVMEAEANQIILQNKTACPGYCATASSTTKVCNDIEKAICKAIKVFDSDLTAGFTQCSSDKGSSCVMIIRSDS